MSKYEATSPVTLIAGETLASGARGLLCIIGAAGRAIRPASADGDAPIVGVFAQDALIAGEPVTVNQLQGKVTMQAQAAIAAGNVVVATAVGNNRGKVNGGADFGAATAVGVALEAAAADGDLIQVLAVPYGPNS